MTVHPRVSLHQVAFRNFGDTGAFFDHAREIGVGRVTIALPMFLQDLGLSAGKRRLTDNGLAIESVCVQFIPGPRTVATADERDSQALVRAVGTAADLGASSVYLVTGARGELTWEAAADRLAALLQPGRDAARARGVELLVEPVSPYHADLHMTHTLRDTIALAELARIGVCIDIHACWYESGLSSLLGRAVSMAGLVQVSDYVLGDRAAPCRAVPGDGVIPLRLILGEILEAGYAGAFDLELCGPRIASEGAREATRRAAEALSVCLAELGV